MMMKARFTSFLFAVGWMIGGGGNLGGPSYAVAAADNAAASNNGWTGRIVSCSG